MTTADAAQLYTPIVGLIGLAFWVGGLSSRVKTLEREAKEQKDEKKAEEASDEADHDRIVKMETILTRVEAKIDHLDRDFDGMKRSLSNLATGRGNQFVRIQEEG
jgi:predicted RNase H-like nuclease (RuvC/YqgF family)